MNGAPKEVVILDFRIDEVTLQRIAQTHLGDIDGNAYLVNSFQPDRNTVES